MLNGEKKAFIERVLEVGELALDQELFEFMIEEGRPAEPFISRQSNYTLGAVLESLAEKAGIYRV